MKSKKRAAPRRKAARVWNKTAKIRSALRQVFRYSPLPSLAKKRAQIGSSSYQCAGCDGLFGADEINVDHVEPVTPYDWTGVEWSEYIDRMFNGDLQVLCTKECHKQKTGYERKMRAVKKRG